MPYLLNLAYLLLLVLISPWLVFKACTTGKYRRGMAQKFWGAARHPRLIATADRTGSLVWLHGVSVGEVHLLRHLVKACRERFPHWHLVVSTTTDTGHDEATKIFADLPVLFWPLDFSWAVNHALDAIRPDLIVLAESELWPNMLRIAEARAIPVAVINARMSPRSAARFAKVSFLTRGLFTRVAAFATQTEEYANHYRMLGANRVVVTGSVKYDGAQSDRANPRTRAMADLLKLERKTNQKEVTTPAPLIWVAGSTQSPEEEVCLAIFRKAREKFPSLRLILVPRQKDRFDEVATLLQKSDVPFVRRSQLLEPTDAPVILVDTIGELGALWGLADLAFVGGSMDGKRGGQNMIEPAAYGAAILFGPHTWNFKDTVHRLRERDAAIEVPDAAALENEIMNLLADQSRRTVLGTAARDFVRSQQGATARTLDVLESLLANPHQKTRAA